MDVLSLELRSKLTVELIIPVLAIGPVEVLGLNEVTCRHQPNKANVVKAF